MRVIYFIIVCFFSNGFAENGILEKENDIKIFWTLERLLKTKDEQKVIKKVKAGYINNCFARTSNIDDLEKLLTFTKKSDAAGEILMDNWVVLMKEKTALFIDFYKSLDAENKKYLTGCFEVVEYDKIQELKKIFDDKIDLLHIYR